MATIFYFCLQIRLSDLEAELLEVNANAEKLLRSRNELAELLLVLEKVSINPSSLA